MKITKVFEKNLDAYLNSYRYIINQGGTRAGKTYAILQLLLFIVLKSRTKKIISVVSQTMPHLKKGAIRDFEEICESIGLNFYAHFNKTDSIFTFNNSIIEFFSADNIGKVHGAKRDILFVNECNFIPYDIFMQLDIRTTKTVFLDYNPIAYFWVHEHLLDKPNSILIKSTYLDNIENLSPEQLAVIENMQKNRNWWTIYGLGEVGFNSDNIFFEKNLFFIEESYLNLQDAQIKLAYVDTADKGGDYFCAVFGALFSNKVYVFDVIFNNNLTLSKNEIILVELLKKYNVDACIIETNKEGSYFADSIRKQVKSKVYGIFNKIDKTTRIMLNADYIIDNFVFLKTQNPVYNDFLKQLYSYNIKGKNEHDDAADALAGLAKFVKDLKINF